ncbi:UNVERIFIED_CONTAM: hypothetical protein Sradi_6933300 [Sesamum radiatum]|uniref:Retrotransposon gag domain-containing protein n=1 Tax=Sesamum radiatum TaxID=300843 RepID=A0AAW2JGX4_SESRA
MGPRWGAGTQSSAARMSGQEPESPRRAASPSERVANPKDENSQLRETMMNLEEKVSAMESEITMLSSELEDCRHVIRELTSAFDGGGVPDMRHEMEQMSIQIGLLQCWVSNGPAVAQDTGARLRISEPKAYNGARDAKEVENFLFDIEQYFLAANVEDEARKVSTATMYLTGDAKLWWRTKYAEIQANQVRLDTWALLREAIREQFFPENVEYNARRTLRKLEHTGFVRNYVKSFSALMLDIRDMSEKDKLFTFMEGLKPWARLELQRQRVTDLESAMATAERLTDFISETRKDRQTTSNPVQNKAGGAKSFRSNSNRGGETESPTLRLVRRAVRTGTSPRRTSRGLRRRAADASYATARIDISHPEEEAQPRNPRKKGLMFVDMKIHGKPIRAMFDTGATHNYLASAEVERLGLVLEKGVGRVKATNSAAQSVAGVAKSMLIKWVLLKARPAFLLW